MRIVIAPDSFKGSATSTQVARAIEDGIRQVAPEAEIVSIPMADGGEGTVEAIVTILGGSIETATVEDPLGRTIEAGYGWVEAQRLAVIEMAAASGLPLLADDEHDPARASTYGTGQLITAALERGAARIILGLGGSATVDGGTGCLGALGIRFLDPEGRPLRGAGGILGDVARIDAAGLDPRLQRIDMTLASDVSNPLLGDNGAVHVFGPQKGVAAGDLDAFEQGMTHYAALVVEATGRDLRSDAGSGAAGGIGYGLRSFLDNVSTRDGFSLIAGLGRLRDEIRSADLVITGEGKLDSQSLYGKVPVGIARIAREEGTFAAAFAGKIEGDPASFEREGLQAVMPIIDEAMPLEQAMADSEALLTRAGRRFMAILSLGRRMTTRVA